jgi:hypothetical protein
MPLCSGPSSSSLQTNLYKEAKILVEETTTPSVCPHCGQSHSPRVICNERLQAARQCLFCGKPSHPGTESYAFGRGGKLSRSPDMLRSRTLVFGLTCCFIILSLTHIRAKDKVPNIWDEIETPFSFDETDASRKSAPSSGEAGQTQSGETAQALELL